MKEQNENRVHILRNLPLVPTPSVWIDSDNQDSVFYQSRDFKKKQSKEELVTKVMMNEEDGYYSYNLEYGYGTDVFGKPRKYIKTQVKNIESPHLQAEQLLYRSAAFAPYSITLQSSIMQGPQSKRFMMSEYRHGNFNSGQIFLHPYEIKNDSGITLAKIYNTKQGEKDFYKIQESIEKGEDIEFIYEDIQRNGMYTFALPAMLPQDLYPYVAEYFEKDGLPELEESMIRPVDLGLFIELQPCTEF